MNTTDTGSNLRLADRLAAVQHSRFVGREAELALFRAALHNPEPPFAVLHVYGPGGIGKTSLLSAYLRLAQEAGVLALYLDGRSIDPSPPGFLNALHMAMGGDLSPLENLAHAGRVVLLIDTYECLTPLDDWLRVTFLPQLPGTGLTIIAGRNPPQPAWRTAPGWRDLTHILSLRYLHPEESRSYLLTRGIPHSQHSAVLQFTHGHPLALSLVADVAMQDSSLFKPEAAPDIVRMLLEHFVAHVPSSQHRAALEVCAHVRVTTESLLAEVFDPHTAHELFQWLYGLSFIEQSAEGIFPHDVVREVLETDLRWRHPERYAQVHRQVRAYFMSRIRSSQGVQQQRYLFDWMFLHRSNRFAQTYHEWESFGHLYTEPAVEHDFPAILQMVQQHEGDESARIAEHWLQRQPEAFFIFRSVSGEIAGFMARLALHRATLEDAEADPAVAAALEYVRHHVSPNTEQEIIYGRYWMGQADYQSVAIFNLASANFGALILTHPNLVLIFMALADVDFWQPYFSYIYYPRCPEVEFEVGGRHYGVVMHDWREQPVGLWLDSLLERELATDTRPEQLENPTATAPFVLSQTEFEQAVRYALRDYTQPDLLAANPLARSRFVMSSATEMPVTTLKWLVREAAEHLRKTPKQEKLYRAVYHTYLQPAPTQEAAAELLDLPFSTYRYHLRHGVKRIVDWLWQRELYGFED